MEKFLFLMLMLMLISRLFHAGSHTIILMLMLMLVLISHKWEPGFTVTLLLHSRVGSQEPLILSTSMCLQIAWNILPCASSSIITIFVVIEMIIIFQNLPETHWWNYTKYQLQKMLCFTYYFFFFTEIALKKIYINVWYIITSRMIQWPVPFFFYATESKDSHNLWK